MKTKNPMRSPWVWIPFVSLVVGYTGSQNEARGADVEFRVVLWLVYAFVIAIVLLAIYGVYRFTKWVDRRTGAIDRADQPTDRG